MCCCMWALGVVFALENHINLSGIEPDLGFYSRDLVAVILLELLLPIDLRIHICVVSSISKEPSHPPDRRLFQESARDY